MTFRIPQVPPSYNTHFKINYRLKQIYLSEEARQFKRLVKLYAPKMSIKNGSSKYSITITVYNDWYYKNGKMRRLDVQNMDKLLIDALCEKLGFDDSRVWRSTISKVQSKEQYTVVDLTLLK